MAITPAALPVLREISESLARIAESVEKVLSALGVSVPSGGKSVLTIREASAMGLRPEHLHDLVRRGLLNNFGTARRPRVSRAALDKMLEGEQGGNNATVLRGTVEKRSRPARATQGA